MASGTRPSTTPRNGSTVAVASMTNAQLGMYFDNDTRIAASVSPVGGTANGLRHKLADGRVSDPQDYEDAAYIRRTLFGSN